MYKVALQRKAEKDVELIKRSGLVGKVEEIIRTVRENPYTDTQGFEKLSADLRGLCSRRINLKHRFLYHVLPNDAGLKDADGNLYDGLVSVISMWSHY